MAKTSVHVLVELTIYEEKFDQFEATAQQMLAASREESGTLGYDFYLSSDRRRCRLLETYKDASAVLAHFKGPVVQQFVPILLELSRLERFEVYGDPGVEMMPMLQSLGADTFPSWHSLKP
jgi:quinol monooxygenase YgiN